MPLTLPAIKELLKSPPNQEAIRTAVAHESRVRLHAETTLTANKNVAIANFTRWVESLIPEYKAYVFKTLFRFPTKSVSLSDQIFAALEKVFDGRDVTRKVSLITSELEENQKFYFSDIDFYAKWRQKSFEVFKTSFNSLVVCDLPTEQKGELPEPYFYFLPIEKVLAFDGDEDKIEWIAFNISETRLAYFDSSAYQVFTMEDGEIVGIESESTHELGYCPVDFFIKSSLSPRAPYQKRSPLSSELSNLDWWLFHAISKQHLDMYASYPIYWGYAPDCEYEDPVAQLHCDGGFLKRADETYLLDRVGGSFVHCPACSSSRLNGAGSYNEVAAPQDKESPDLRAPVGIVSVDDKSLKFNVEEQKRLRTEIYTNVTGFGGDLKTDQAVNEKQVAASFDTRAAVLKTWKVEFERAEQWVTKTICKLRYKDGFVGAYINLGTEFYLYTPQELLDMYSRGLREKWSDQILTMLQDQYYETKHMNDPVRMARVKTITALEPYRHLTKPEVMDLFNKGIIEFEDLYIKINFSSILDRFERENGDIMKFARRFDFDKKIELINETFYSYASEKKPSGEIIKENSAATQT